MLNVVNLSKSFGDLPIFADLELTVPQNGFTVLIGPSGCGKSTLFDVLTGAVAGDSGTITWRDKPVSNLRELSAYMQQKDMLLPWLSLMDNALLPARISGSDMTSAAAKAADVVVVTIAYRLQGVDCGNDLATRVLADMASDPADGPATADDGGDGPGGLPGGCEDTAAIASENADGDLFFCAPEPGQLSAVFTSALDAILIQFANKTSLVRPPS